ncbi:hypothetical protein ACSBR1_024971 [Camellia fascicularis]
MVEIVENCCATRALVGASTQGAPDSDENDEILNKFWSPGAGGSNAAKPIVVDLFGDEYMEPLKGKSYKRGPARLIVVVLKGHGQAKTEHSHARSTDTEAVSAGGDDYSLDACQNALLELGDIPPVQYIRALTLFKDKEWRRFFMRTPAHIRLAMILTLQ